MKPDKTIVEKIKKLLALAEGNKNEHEREVAMRFAMDWLAKHNLTMSEVQGATLNLDVEEIQGNFRLERWMSRVLETSCILYYTDFYTGYRQDRISGSWKLVPIFVGTADNIAVTIEVATWLMNSIRLESNRVYKDAYERRSFRLGAADTLMMRAIDMVVDEQCAPAAGTGTSLMVVRDRLQKANQEHMSSLNLRKTRRRRAYIDGDAYADGEEYGNKVRLNKQGRERAAVQARNPQLAGR
jgi:hypothetical protein